MTTRKTVTVDLSDWQREAATRAVLLVLSDWTQLPEVDAYAAKRGIDIQTAIHELVNAGLSHWHDFIELKEE
jgi:hypothetical protein